jgi:hypothetical protein
MDSLTPPPKAPPGFSLPRPSCVLLGILAVAAALLDPPRELRLGYIDPGFGVMILQLVTAAFFGMLFYLKGLGRYVARFIARLRGRASD